MSTLSERTGGPKRSTCDGAWSKRRRYSTRLSSGARRSSKKAFLKPRSTRRRYSLNEMPDIRAIFETVHCELDHNVCERLNWDISLSMLYSLIASCKLHGINPKEYLKCAMDRMLEASPLYKYERLRL